ncbi:hypothetical protein BsWGS_22571 [Bradybaena similaris]
MFIHRTLGRYLPACLQEVTEVKPADPIEYIANWLYKVYDSRIYYQAKVDYMRNICQLNENLNQEKLDHEAKMKPFMEAVEAERLNYLMSLRAELQALEGMMAQEDAGVDEVTKLRLLEVQLLIKEEGGEEKRPAVRKPPAKVASVKLVQENWQPETPKSPTLEPVSARHSSQILTEKGSIVLVKTPSLEEEAASSQLARRRRSSAASLARVSRRPPNYPTLSAVGVSNLQRGLGSASTSQSRGVNRKQTGVCAGINQGGTTRFFRYVLDESESFVVDPFQSSSDSSDSEAEQQGELKAYEWKQQMGALSAANGCFEVAMRYSDDEDSDIQANKIGEEFRDRRLSAYSSRTKCHITERSRLPMIIPQGKHTKENVAMSLRDADEERGGFHLPPVRIHGDTSKVVFADDDVLSERQDSDVSVRSASSDQAVHLPDIGSRTTGGTLIMTNNGHIAFVNKELGVIAPNSLKIRSVHPIDKPEMWARRNFQCQSFYDHELYSEADYAPVDSEEEERWRRPVPRMSAEECVQPPDRRRKKPKVEVDYYP